MTHRNPDHILLDARKLNDYGIGTYIQSLAQGLRKQLAGTDLKAFVGAEPGASDNLPEGWTAIPTNYGKYSLSEYFLLGSRVRSARPDIYHIPHFTVPLSTGVPTVVTIQDVIPLLFPDIFNAAKRGYASMMIRHALRTADAVIATSQRTRDDLVELFGSDPASIRVIPLGVGAEFFVRERRPALAERFRAETGVTAPYVLFVSNLKPHKGVRTLLHAYSEVVRSHPGLALVVIGGSPEDIELLRGSEDFSPQLRSSIHFLGRVSDESVRSAFAGAELFVMPSLYEGFGLTVLEAMAAGTPVVCSDGGALPEVVGDAAIVVEKGNSGALAEAIRSALEDSARRERLTQLGFARAETYSWEKTATRTIECYREIVT